MKTMEEIKIREQRINTQGLKLAAQTDRYEIWDDQKRNRAVVIVGQGPGSNPSSFMTTEIPRPEKRLQRV